MLVIELGHMTSTVDFVRNVHIYVVYFNVGPLSFNVIKKNIVSRIEYRFVVPQYNMAWCTITKTLPTKMNIVSCS